MKTSLIFAKANLSGRWLIGDGEGMPWNVKEDLAHFSSLTRGHAVIMGRATWLSIGAKPLEGRLNVVLSRKLERIAGAVLAHSMEEALEECRREGHQKAFVIGGSGPFQEALGFASEAFVTEIAGRFQGSVFAPNLTSKENCRSWKEVEKSEWKKSRCAKRQGYRFLRFEKR